MTRWHSSRFGPPLARVARGLCLSALLTAALAGFAETTAETNNLEPTSTGRPASGGVIQPFDRIDIQVKREPQLSDIYTVTPSGTVEFPLVGSVQASGRTAESLKKELETILGGYLRRPEVTVELLEPDRVRSDQVVSGGGSTGTYSVYIVGAIPTPGVYFLREAVNPFQLIVRAGGIDGVTQRGYDGQMTGLFPDLRNVTVLGEDGALKRVDLSGWSEGKLALEMLKPGDTVIVPGHRAGNFAIYGEVGEQGVYEIGQPILLTEAIARAGGLIRFSDFAKIQILRGDPKNPEALRVNLKEVLAKKKVELLPVIHPGDTIYVPRNLLSKWFDFVEVIRGARRVTEDVEEMRDHWTLRDIDRD